MGLDMFMSAEKFVVGEVYASDRDKMTYQVLTTAMGMTEDETSSLRRKSLTVSIGVGYWRKAHDIHGWFVENVQDGVDNCGEYYVSRTSLTELKEGIERVLADPDEYQDEFSTTEDWDSDVELVFKDTLTQIEDWLSPKYDGWEFRYSSSW